MYRGIFLLSLRGCVYSVVFTLLGLCCWVYAVELRCWVCAVEFVLLGLRCCVCAVVFALLGLCCWVCAVAFVLLDLCCCVCAVGFTLLCPEFCPPTTHAVVFSIVAFLFMLVPMLWSDFGYFHFLKLHYVHFSHHGLLFFLRHGFFLDIFAS